MQSLESIYESFGISKNTILIGKEVEESLKERIEKLEETCEYNQLKVIRAMKENKVR